MTEERGRHDRQAGETVPTTTTMTLTVHLTLDDRYEDGCVAVEAMARLAADGDEAWWTEGVLVDAVTSADGPTWGYHLTELYACPHCHATLDVPLSEGLSCTNEWHHLGERQRRLERRREVVTSGRQLQHGGEA